MSNFKPINFTVPTSKRVLLFLLVTVLCYIVASVLIAIIAYKGEMSAAKLRISTILQDLIVFILPSLIVAMMITRRPADFLTVSKSPGLLPSILTVILIPLMAPAMNLVVVWNEGLKLPESLAGLQAVLENLEKDANSFTTLLMSGSSVGSIIISILIIGFLTGFSEELYFRGMLQRLIATSRTSPHLAIWCTAFIFSAVHLQIFGFIPRLLLGAIFGYLLWWSGSVWLAIIAHITNNTMVVLATKFSSPGSIDFNTIGATSTSFDRLIFWVSLCATAACLVSIYALTRNQADKPRFNQTVSD
ncbi:MAG: CPBP family intramembrane metalloprotease [Paramuribaculum sp.]|nr:CPBP family intramembrane metalloprotease [Paramuribaculum sp.]